MRIPIKLVLISAFVTHAAVAAAAGNAARMMSRAVQKQRALLTSGSGTVRSVTQTPDVSSVVTRYKNQMWSTRLKGDTLRRDHYFTVGKRSPYLRRGFRTGEGINVAEVRDSAGKIVSRTAATTRNGVRFERSVKD